MKTVNTGIKKNITKGSLDMVLFTQLPGSFIALKILFAELNAILLDHVFSISYLRAA